MKLEKVGESQRKAGERQDKLGEARTNLEKAGTYWKRQGGTSKSKVRQVDFRISTFLIRTSLRQKFCQNSFSVFSPSFFRAPPRRSSRPHPGTPGEPRETVQSLDLEYEDLFLLDLRIRRKFEKDYYFRYSFNVFVSQNHNDPLFRTVSRVSRVPPGGSRVPQGPFSEG